MSATFTAFLAIVCLAVAVFIIVYPRSRKPAPRDDGYTPAERSDINAINKGICPDCGSNGTLLAGPSGGMLQNVGCNHCLMEFNVGFGFGTGALMVDRTGKMSESRARVFGIQPSEFAAAAQ